MAIAFTNLGVSGNPDINSSTDATSYANTSWTPPTSGLIIVWIYSAEAAQNTQVNSVTGNSLTWIKITDLGWGTGAAPVRRTSLFAADATGATTGVTTIDFGSFTEIGCMALFFQATGVDISGGVASAFVQTKGVAQSANTSLSITLDSGASNSNNRCISCFMHNANEVTDPRTNWTELDDLAGANPARGSNSQYRDDIFEQTGSASWATSILSGGIVAELKASTGAPATLSSDDPPIGILGRGAGW